jgi:hypothetical protein
VPLHRERASLPFGWRWVAKDLTAALTDVKRYASNKGAIPVLQCLKLVADGDAVTLTATDLECAIVLNLNAEVTESGTAGNFKPQFLPKGLHLSVVAPVQATGSRGGWRCWRLARIAEYLMANGITAASTPIPARPVHRHPVTRDSECVTIQR